MNDKYLNLHYQSLDMLGARHAVLVHAVSSVDGRFVANASGDLTRTDGSRGRGQLRGATTDHVEELGAIARECAQFGAEEVREFLEIAHVENTNRLREAWFRIRDVFEQTAPSLLIGVPVLLLHRPVDLSHLPPSRLGEWYADSTYWAIGVLDKLFDVTAHLKEHDSTCHGGGAGACGCEERACADDVRNALAYFRTLRQDIHAIAYHYDHLDEADLRAVLFDLNETTLSRTRSIEVTSRSIAAAALRDPTDHTRIGDPQPDWLPNLEDIIEPPVDQEPPADTDYAAEPAQRRQDERVTSMTFEHSPYELGEHHSAVYAFALEEVPRNLDKARAKLAELAAVGRALDRMDEPSRLQFLWGAHHETVYRLESQIRCAARLLSPPDQNDEWAPTPPDGWPTHDDVLAERHNGTRWIVPFDHRYPDRHSPLPEPPIAAETATAHGAGDTSTARSDPAPGCRSRSTN